MQKHYKKYLIISILISLVMVSGAYLLKNSKNSNTNTTLAVYNAKQLAINNGKNNAPCYVAIDDKVYSIKQGNLWKEGNHTPSNGLAYCGKDLSDALKKSPHGRSKLPALTIVGIYKK